MENVFISLLHYIKDIDICICVPTFSIELNEFGLALCDKTIKFLYYNSPHYIKNIISGTIFSHSRPSTTININMKTDNYEVIIKYLKRNLLYLTHNWFLSS